MNEQKRKPIGILLTVILISALLTICLELGLSYLRPDTPGSIPKHLIHFAIMFALLGSAVLLCLFCPPFKKLWAWIDEHILSQETRPIAIDIVYAIFAGLMLLHHFYVLLYYPTIPSGASKLAPIWIVFAAITVILSKSWRNHGFRIAVIFLIYTFERLYAKNLIITSNNSVYFVSAIYSICICFCAFSSLRSCLWKPFLKAICMLWALGMLLLSLIGLYTAWTGIQINNLVDSTIYLFEGRLSIFAIPTITSSYLGCGIIMALICFVISKHKTFKILYLLICIMIMIANSLTDSRSSFMMTSIMISGMICLGIWILYRNQKSSIFSRKKTAFVFTVLILCFGLCFYIAVECQRIMGIQFVEIRNNGSILRSANADETIIDAQSDSIVTPQPPQFEQRDVWFSVNTDIDITLHGRYEIWENGFNYLKKKPETVLFGVSVDGSIVPVVVRWDHSHNILLQNLFEGGIPALLLYLILVFYGIFHAFRLWNRRSVPFWHRILPLPVFALLLWEMAECLTHFSFGHPPMTLFWFFLGATITVSKSLGKAPKAAEQPAIPAESAVTETGE